MLTRLVRTQLIIFTIASVVGMAVMVFGYMQIPTMLGLGKVVVTLQLPASGGLYPLANVTYRGVQIGKVTAVVPTAAGAEATLTLDRSPAVPADLRVEVRSISALGEQYVELLPRGTSDGYLRDGSVIPVQDASIPQPVGPMLDQVSKLVDSIPGDKLGQLLDESFQAFNGAGYDLGSLIDSSKKLTGDLNGVADQTRALVVDGGPLLDSQAQTPDSIRTWAHSLAGISDQLVANDPQLRSVLHNGPAAAQEATQLLAQVKPTLPVLLANLTTVGQIAVTYNPSLEQILVLLPAYIAAQDSFALPQNNPTGWPLADFTITASDPPPCTAGFLPPSEWRSPAATDIPDTPDGLYCKLPQDSPISVRGARNYPCMGKPGKRAPTVEICDSDQPYEPLSIREHTLGPYPIDPNLIAQGIPPDGRVNPDRNIYGPLDGTPMPVPAPPAAPSAAPSAYRGPDQQRPPMAVARYDTATGRYLTAGGQLMQQTNLAAAGPGKTWKDLLPT
jgi:virulence factor Mce-like protein